MSKIVEITNYLSNIINNFDDMAFETFGKAYSICQLISEILHEMKKNFEKNHIKIINRFLNNLSCCNPSIKGQTLVQNVCKKIIEQNDNK